MDSLLHIRPWKCIQELIHTPNNMRRVRKLQHIYCLPKYTHECTQTHRVHSVLFSILSVTQAAADTKHSFPPTLSLSSFSHTPSHRLSFCLPLSSSSSPCFLPLLPVSWAATWSSNRHPRSRLFYCFVEWREREGEASQIIQSEGERMRGKKSTNIASRH